MNKKYLLLSLEDERVKIVADILGNKTSNKIIDFLSEKKEASEKDISEELKLPINTIEYNIRKMIKAGLIEESKNFFWSQKGRKIKMYRFSNKSIVISPKAVTSNKLGSEVKQILPIGFISGFAAVGIKAYLDSQAVSFMGKRAADAVLSATETAAQSAGESVSVINTGNYFIWFIGGFIFMIVMFLIKIILYEKILNNNFVK